MPGQHPEHRAAGELLEPVQPRAEQAEVAVTGADAVVLVVSEETGALSLAYDSKLYYGLSGAQVRERLAELLGGTPHHASGDEEPVPETEELS